MKLPGFINKMWRAVRLGYLKMIREPMPPHNIAIGLAVGVFAGFLPIIPFQTIVALVFAWPVRGSKIAAALGTWVSNPLNWVPFYMMLYYVGKAVSPFSVPPFNPSLLEFKVMIQQGWQWLAVMCVGGVVLGIPASIISYVLCLRAVKVYRARKAARRAAAKAEAVIREKQLAAGKTAGQRNA